MARGTSLASPDSLLKRKKRIVHQSYKVKDVKSKKLPKAWGRRTYYMYSKREKKFGKVAVRHRSCICVFKLLKLTSIAFVMRYNCETLRSNLQKKPQK